MSLVMPVCRSEMVGQQKEAETHEGPGSRLQQLPCPHLHIRPAIRQLYGPLVGHSSQTKDLKPALSSCLVNLLLCGAGYEELRLDASLESESP
jgi:hypothetical protein